MLSIAYRLWQVCQQLGFVAPLSTEEYSQVAQWLPASALPLFRTMSDADQRHSLRVCQGLLERGCIDRDLLAAALLHDVGKAQGRVPFWTRPAIVLGKLLAPRLLRNLTVYPYESKKIPAWQRSLAMPGGMPRLEQLLPQRLACRKKQFSTFARTTSLMVRLPNYIW